MPNTGEIHVIVALVIKSVCLHVNINRILFWDFFGILSAVSSLVSLNPCTTKKKKENTYSRLTEFANR